MTTDGCWGSPVCVSSRVAACTELRRCRPQYLEHLTLVEGQLVKQRMRVNVNEPQGGLITLIPSAPRTSSALRVRAQTRLSWPTLHPHDHAHHQMHLVHVRGDNLGELLEERLLRKAGNGNPQTDGSGTIPPARQEASGELSVLGPPRCPWPWQSLRWSPRWSPNLATGVPTGKQ